MAVLEVGIGRPYTTIQSAIIAASTNDIIFVKPGNYEESLLINKRVHFLADTPHPEVGIVRIYNIDSDPMIINYSPTSGESIHIEGFEIERLGSATSSVYIQSSNKNLSLYFNRCSLLQSSNGGICLDASGGPHKIDFTNCYLSSNGLHLSNTAFADVVNLIKTELNAPLSITNGTPTTTDVVIQPTYAYGPAYGKFNITPAQYFLKGNVYLNGNPVVRKIKAYLTQNTVYSYHEDKYIYVYVGETTSSGTNGSFYLTTTYSGTHDIICEDDTAGLKYNSLIYSSVIPILIPNSQIIP